MTKLGHITGLQQVQLKHFETGRTGSSEYPNDCEKDQKHSNNLGS